MPIPPNIGQIRANREKALLSHIWNHAREQGFTKAPNPVRESKDFANTDATPMWMTNCSPRSWSTPAHPLHFALRLAHLTGQRPGDVLRMSEVDIAGGILRVTQGNVAQPVQRRAGGAGIDKAMFQFRDLRAKAATDTDGAAGTRGAQALPRHTTESMTAHYLRHKAGRKVRLLK